MGQSSSAPVPGPQGIRGDIGPIGVSITNASISPTGLMTLTFSDGKTQTVQVPPGNPGVGIKNATVNGTGLITFTMTDGTTNTVQIPMGLQGPPGKSITGETGPIGKSGVGIATASVDNSSGLITFTMTDGSTKAVQIPKGLTGNAGVGIKGVTVNTTGLMTLAMSDNSTQTVQLPVGSVPQANLMYCNGNVCSNSLVGINLTNNWKGFPMPTNGLSEISNDTTTYKALMLAGNMSSGNGRQVNVYDDLRIDRNLTVGGNSSLSNQLGLNNLKPSYTFDMTSNSTGDSSRIKNANSKGFGSIRFENDTGAASYVGIGGSGTDPAYANNLYLASANINNVGNTTMSGNLNVTGTTNLNGDVWSRPFSYQNQAGGCLDSAQFGSNQNGTYQCNGSGSQKWQHNLLDGRLRHVGTNDCVAAFGTNGGTWNLAPCDTGNSQDTHFTRVGGSLQSYWGNCLDNSNNNKNASCNTNSSQRWQMNY